MYATGFRYYFTPLPGYFSPFPHGTHPLSAHQGLVFRLSRWSCQIHTKFHESRATWENEKTSDRHTPTGVSPSTLRLSNRFNFIHQFITRRPVNSQTTTHPTTPAPQHLSAITRHRFSLIHFRSPLLTESLLFSLPTGTEMFHFPAFPPTTLYIQAEVTGHNSGIKVTPFGNPRIKTRLPTPLGLSQVTTSFIGSWCQGIHRSH